MSYSRRTARDALAALLTTALTGSGNPAQAAYGYPVKDFRGQSPVVILASSSSKRDQETIQARREANLYFDIRIFVRHVDTGWTEQDTENSLDAIEAAIDEVIAANRCTSNWRWIEYDGQTSTDIVPVGGKDYRYERIPIRIEVGHD